MKAHHPSLRFVRAAALCAALVLASWSRADEAGFSDGLSPDEKAASGVSRLTDAQASALDALVAQDVTLAHDGGVTGFSSGFTARHSGSEGASAGIEKLSASERSKLDILAARSIAIGPPPDQAFSYKPPRTAPVPTKVAVSDPRQVEVHGDLSFTVGAGSHGSSFYGTAMDVNVTDPTGRFTIGVGFEEFRGRGLLGLCAPEAQYGPLFEPGYPGYPGW